MADSTITSLLDAATRPLLSIEFFPPKKDEAFERLKRTVKLLRAAEPDFVTVTYGAGGTTRERTLEVCGLLREMGLDPIMPHLTCVGSSRDELNGLADEIWDLGYRNVMTLRGDPPKGETEFKPHPDGLPQAADLVSLLRARHPNFCCGVAGYPETHPEAVSPEQDIAYLKQKLDAGAGFVTTQLFFDNQAFFDFVDRCRASGITQPIVPGLLPAVSLKQVKRICGMCRASLPAALEEELVAAGDNAEAAAEVGMDWGARQIEELLASGVPGIHMYILNRAHTGLALSVIQNFNRNQP